MTDTAKLLIFSCKECRRPARFCVDAYTRFGNLRGYELTYTPTSHINGVDVCCPRDADGDCDYVAGHRCQLVPVSLRNCVRLSSATGHAVCVHCEAVLEQGVCCDELFGEMNKLFGYVADRLRERVLRQRKQANKATKLNKTRHTQEMAYQLLEIVDGDLRVCYEYGNHEELHMKTPSWITIYKRDASVSLSLTHFHTIVEQDWEGLLEHGLHVNTNIDDGRVLVEANGPDMPHGELLVRNGEAVWKTQPQQPTHSERHQLLLTLAEHALLTAMECVLTSFARVSSLGCLRIGLPDGIVERKHTLTATQLFYIIGGLHACEFTPGGQFTVEPFRVGQLKYDCGAHTPEVRAWADKARLQLTYIDADTLLEFNAEQVGEGVVPPEGLQFHLSEERGVGIWPSQNHFPDGDAACALVPFTPSEWRWLCACIDFYQAAAFYLKERGRRSAARPRPAAQSTPAAEADA